jgi:Pectate lyase superfamily protein
MAVIEIAKIQVRRGQEKVTGIPTLSPGEFGWAEDTENLYIGKSITEGAVTNDNTRILTENDLQSFYSTSATAFTAYQYQGHVNGFTVTNTVIRTLQSKLDDSISVLDYDVLGDGVSLNAVYLQNAIDSLYLNTVVKNTGSNQTLVSLNIPAGIYNIERTVYLPKYVTLVGDGPGKTIINLTAANAALFQFVDQGATPGSYSSHIFVDGQVNMQGGTQPEQIVIKDMTLKYDVAISSTSSLSLLRVDCASDCLIDNVQFLGNYVAGASQPSTNNYAGIEIRGQGPLTTRDLIINNCSFDNLYYGIKSNYDIEDSIVFNSRFRNLNRGIIFSESTALANFTGPLRTRIENNKFFDIEQEGIYVGNPYGNYPTYHRSAFNVFKNVGNNLNNDNNPITSVINFLTPGNISLADYNSRFDYLNNTTSNVASSVSLVVNGPSYIESVGVYTTNITAGTNVLVKLPYSGFGQTTKLQYNISKPATNVSRTGEVKISSALLATTSTVSVTDNYTFDGPDDGVIDFSAVLNTVTNLVVLSYTSFDSTGTITYKYNQLQ